ncbi:MAG: hypothetical protein SF052_20520 [Bacteroidia bacterium]|nr:hypothetical protein [Bacteroidia bacterium]
MNPIEIQRKRFFWILLLTVILLLVLDNFNLFKPYISYLLVLVCGAGTYLAWRIAVELWGKVLFSGNTSDFLEEELNILEISRSKKRYYLQMLEEVEIEKIEQAIRIEQLKKSYRTENQLFKEKSQKLLLSDNNGKSEK